MNETKQAQRVRLFGHAHAEKGYELRDFLQRSVAAFDWLELHNDEDSQRELRIPELGRCAASGCETFEIFQRAAAFSWSGERAFVALVG